MPFLADNREPSKEVQIWLCDPLVVVHPDDGIVYAMRTEAEFIPDGTGYGSIRALITNAKGWQPSIQITDWHDLPDTSMLPYRKREGRTLFGHDEQGFAFTWHINYAADLFLASGEKVPPAGEEPPPRM